MEFPRISQVSWSGGKAVYSLPIVMLGNKVSAGNLSSIFKIFLFWETQNLNENTWVWVYAVILVWLFGKSHWNSVSMEGKCYCLVELRTRSLSYIYRHGLLLCLVSYSDSTLPWTVEGKWKGLVCKVHRNMKLCSNVQVYSQIWQKNILQKHVSYRLGKTVAFIFGAQCAHWNFFNCFQRFKMY